MNRSTHLLIGAAAAAPIAITLAPLPAAGCIWFGVAGGAMPDYLDLRSSARRMLKHRGVSHSLVIAGLCSLVVYVLLDGVSQSGFELVSISPSLAVAWSLAFACGMISHLAADACTIGGIQPALPFVRRRFWLLPRFFRGRSDGAINVIGRVAAVLVLGVALAIYLSIGISGR
jgi:membrane-bound metal-dependent hydrolase YbcI (DUF457 family)